MRIAIDATPILGNPTGVGVFTRALIDGLVHHKDTQLHAYAASLRGHNALRRALPSAIKTNERPIPASILFPTWLRIDAPKIERWTGAVDVVHATNFIAPPSNAPSLLTVHDLTSIRYPELCDGESLRYPRHIKRALSRGADLHVPTTAIQREVCAEFGISTERVHVVHHGISTPVDIDADDERWATELTDGAPYLLSVGTIEPRKDYPSLVRAFDQINRQFGDLKLVIVGARAWGAEALDATLAHLENRKNVIQLGYVSDRARSALLRGATAFAYPSVYEGFGFPPLEAMSVGTPVVVTRSAALEETCGDGALYSDVKDVDSLAANISTVLTDDVARKELIERGHTRAESFRWDAAIENMCRVYDVVSKR